VATAVTEKVEQMPADRFAALWNGSAGLDEAAERVRAEVGKPCPLWAVLARAVALRGQGMHLKAMPKTGQVFPA
jgi:hypothetical protein